MKKVGIIGLSVATAALIMAGCGSSSSSSGVSPAKEASAPVVIDSSNVGLGLWELKWETGYNSLSTSATEGSMKLKTKAAEKVADQRASFLAKVAKVKDSGTYKESGSETYDCPAGGSYTEVYSYTETYDTTTGGYKYTEDYNYDYNDCKYIYNTTINGEPTNLRFTDGKDHWTYSEGYDADGNVSSWDYWEKTSGYTYGYENNTTSTSRVYTDNYTWNEKWVEGSDSYMIAQGEGTYNESYVEDYHRIDTNSTGAQTYGYKYEYKYNYAEEYKTDWSYWKETYNTVENDYDLNTTTGKFDILTWAEYAKNFVVTVTHMGNEYNTTASGVYGNTDMGGSMTYKIDPTAQKNRVDYHSASTTDTYYLFPHAGKISLTGASGSTAALQFDSNTSNYTSAELFVDGVSEGNYTDWSQISY